MSDGCKRPRTDNCHNRDVAPSWNSMVPWQQMQWERGGNITKGPLWRRSPWEAHNRWLSGDTIEGNHRKRSRDEQEGALSSSTDDATTRPEQNGVCQTLSPQHTGFGRVRGVENETKKQDGSINPWAQVTARKRPWMDSFCASDNQENMFQWGKVEKLSKSNVSNADRRGVDRKDGEQPSETSCSWSSNSQMPPKKSQRFQALASRPDAESSSSSIALIDLTVDNEPVDLLSDEETAVCPRNPREAQSEAIESKAGHKGVGTRNDPIELDVDIIHQCLIDLISGETEERRNLARHVHAVAEESQPWNTDKVAGQSCEYREDKERKAGAFDGACDERSDQQLGGRHSQHSRVENKKQFRTTGDPQPMQAHNEPHNNRRVTSTEANDIYRSARDEVFNLDREIQQLIQKRRKLQQSRNRSDAEEIENCIIELRERRQLAGQLAADDIYRRMNSCAGMGWDVGNSDGRSVVKVDFHGLHKRDVQRKVDELLIPVLPTLSQIVVVTGKGLHSRDGISHIKMELLSLLESLPYRENMEWEQVRGNHGAILIRWKGTSQNNHK